MAWARWRLLNSVSTATSCIFTASSTVPMSQADDHRHCGGRPPEANARSTGFDASNITTWIMRCASRSSTSPSSPSCPRRWWCSWPTCSTAAAGCAPTAGAQSREDRAGTLQMCDVCSATITVMKVREYFEIVLVRNIAPKPEIFDAARRIYLDLKHGNNSGEARSRPTARSDPENHQAARSARFRSSRTQKTGLQLLLSINFAQIHVSLAADGNYALPTV
jgi:hypothetical protein